MRVIGLTGSIGMGKTTVGRMFRRYYGCPVFEADDEVHDLFRTDRTLLTLIKKTFPTVIDEEGINRGRLSERVMEESQDS